MARDYVNTSDVATELRGAVVQCTKTFGKPRVDAAVTRAQPSTLAFLRNGSQAPPAQDQ
jgi:hypothetical protein